MANEDTLKIEQGNESLIAEMLRDAQKANVPSSLKESPVIHKGDATLEAPTVVVELSGPDYVWVWDTETHVRMPIINYMLPSKLRQRRLNGSFRFTTVDPKQLPSRGTIKCLLHIASEQRPHYNDLGFRICPKDNIRNLFQLEQHMKKKHPQEWATIELERTRKEKEEDRALQHLLLTSQMRAGESSPVAEVELGEKEPQDNKGEAPLYVSGKKKTDKKKVKSKKKKIPK